MSCCETEDRDVSYIYLFRLLFHKILIRFATESRIESNRMAKKTRRKTSREYYEEKHTFSTVRRRLEFWIEC